MVALRPEPEKARLVHGDQVRVGREADTLLLQGVELARRLVVLHLNLLMVLLDRAGRGQIVAILPLVIVGATAQPQQIVRLIKLQAAGARVARDVGRVGLRAEDFVQQLALI